jgi:hypothetical protein
VVEAKESKSEVKTESVLGVKSVGLEKPNSGFKHIPTLLRKYEINFSIMGKI